MARIRASRKKWKLANAEKVKEYETARRAKTVEKRRARERDLYAQNPEKMRAKRRRNRANNRDGEIEKLKIWRANNKVRIARYAAKRRLENIDHIKHKIDCWRAENPEKVKAHARNRKARMRGADGGHTAEEVTDLYERQGRCCANPFCGKSLADGYHGDHIIPVSRGGSNFITNIQLLCPPCNLGKGRKSQDEWLKQQAMNIAA